MAIIQYLDKPPSRNVGMNRATTMSTTRITAGQTRNARKADRWAGELVPAGAGSVWSLITRFFLYASTMAFQSSTVTRAPARQADFSQVEVCYELVPDTLHHCRRFVLQESHACSKVGALGESIVEIINSHKNKSSTTIT
jgi:hypothetical protein